MASPNMRLVANNLIGKATISASSSVGLLVAENLKKPGKTLVHRTSGTSVTYTVTFPSPQRVGMVALPFTNLTKNATIFVGTWPTYLDTTVEPPVQRYGDTGNHQGAKGDIDPAYGWEAPAGGVNTFAYGGGRYCRVWFGNVTVSSLTITVNDPGNPDGYLEAAYMVIGEWWSPDVNPSYGASVTAMDTSKHDRTDASDLVTTRGVVYRKLTLPMNDMAVGDRTKIWQLLRSNGMSKPVYVSLFPENGDWNKEAMHEVYGKLSSLAALSSPNYSQFATSLDFEEL